ncbi:PLDc_N domain-containing protein [Pseudomonas capeferrum]|uniref:PLD nuclease N-terminal domain-containing protein n=1 Tax=Pseudomonas capeferrum TaxID=1495066 RepID=UPI0015E44F93|nr:PLD nuclease N-terminal domain-containing protein [Pseudomonas capeferrum]MBA1200582.1 PLDc_N domain-containing protein [Pseudomonas capeferrum]
METSFFWLAAAVVVIALDLWALNSVWRSTKSSGTKVAWTLLIFILPLVGLIIWGIAGPRGIARPPSSPNHSKG